jgi:chromosome segregation ATPase
MAVAGEEPKLRRGLLGYSKRSVRLSLADQSRLLQEATDEAGSNRSELERSREELSRVREDLARRTEEARSAGERVRELGGELEMLEQRLAAETDLRRQSEGRLEVVRAEIDAQSQVNHKSYERATLAETRATQLEERLASTERRAAELDAQANDALERLAASERAAIETDQKVADELDSLRDRLTKRGQVADLAAREALEQQTRADDLEDQVVQLRQEAERLRAQIDQGTSPVGSVHRLVPRTEEEAIAPSEEIAAAIDVAEEAMSRILDSGRRRAAAEFEELERRLGDFARETELFEDRRNRIATASTEVRPTLDEARMRISGLEGMFGSLLASLGALESHLARLEEATRDAQQVPADEPLDDPHRGSGEANPDGNPPSPWPAVGS